jgi:hypothetical protein
MDLKEIRRLDRKWIYVAHDMDHCRGSGKRVMNLIIS